jgi:hypothetical protein
MTHSGDDEAEYGPHSADYGLSYEPDPWADPEPAYDPDAWESEYNQDHAEAVWEQALRDGHITREQFARRRLTSAPAPPAPEADQAPAIRTAIEKLRARLADPSLSAEERAQEERTMASLERMLNRER